MIALNPGNDGLNAAVGQSHASTSSAEPRIFLRDTHLPWSLMVRASQACHLQFRASADHGSTDGAPESQI